MKSTFSAGGFSPVTMQVYGKYCAVWSEVKNLAWIIKRVDYLTQINSSGHAYSCPRGIMGEQLGALLKPLITIVLWWCEGIQGGLNWAPWCWETLLSWWVIPLIGAVFQSGHGGYIRGRAGHWRHQWSFASHHTHNNNNTSTWTPSWWWDYSTLIVFQEK